MMASNAARYTRGKAPSCLVVATEFRHTRISVRTHSQNMVSRRNGEFTTVPARGMRNGPRAARSARAAAAPKAKRLTEPLVSDSMSLLLTFVSAGCNGQLAGGAGERLGF